MSADGVELQEQDIALLQDMLAIYSPSTQEGELARYLVGAMAQRGLRATIDEAGNAVGECGEGETTVMLLGHMDTVPGFIPVRIEGGRIFGRGAVDAKGPLATFVAAAASLPAGLDKRVVVIGAVEEETRSSKGAHYILERYRPDYVVVGEPSGWDSLTLGYKGRLLADFSVQKRASHSARREPTAAELAVAFWNEVLAYVQAYNRARTGFDTLDVALDRIRSSNQDFSDRAEATLGFRVPPGLELARLQQDILGLKGPGSLDFYGQAIPFRAGKDNRLVRLFLQAIRQAGGHPSFKLKTGTSDMNVVGPRWAAPILAYGPGDSSLDHTPDEHLELAEYALAICLLASVIRSL